MKLQMFSDLLAGRSEEVLVGSWVVIETWSHVEQTLQEHLDQPSVTRSTTAGV